MNEMTKLFSFAGWCKKELTLKSRMQQSQEVSFLKKIWKTICEPMGSFDAKQGRSAALVSEYSTPTHAHLYQPPHQPPAALLVAPPPVIVSKSDKQRWQKKAYRANNRDKINEARRKRYHYGRHIPGVPPGTRKPNYW